MFRAKIVVAVQLFSYSPNVALRTKIKTNTSIHRCDYYQVLLQAFYARQMANATGSERQCPKYTAAVLYFKDKTMDIYMRSIFRV